MAASHNYTGLLISRTLLGIFEAAVLPMFTIIVSNWYRRSEQPFRVAAFYSTNGIATILGSFLSWALGHIKSGPLHSYQIIFLTTGLVTVVTAPIIYFFLDNSVAEARFLSPEDRLKGVERLKANKTGVGLEHEFKWRQVLEVFLEPKTWLWMAMNAFLNAGASVSNAFGPILLGSFGFDSFTLTLLNMPFGALQFIFIWLTSWLAWHTSKKSPILFGTVVPPIVGLAVLYSMGRSASDRGANLVGYYLLAPLFAGNPLIIAWLAANTAGHTKKATIMTFYQVFLAVGNIVGPFLFTDKDKPYYYHGILVVLGFFIAIAALVVMGFFNLVFLNKLQERKRVKNGKPAKLEDLSMSKHFVVHSEDTEAALVEQVEHGGIDDRTDRENDEFIYV
ncbi:major facilitator superfamily domain-containing protein, partial [Flagelloscypha sp. PMI_526]